MPECMLLTREMLKNPIEVSVAASLGFKQAQELARRQAGEICRELMFLAWFYRARGRFKKQISCIFIMARIHALNKIIHIRRNSHACYYRRQRS
jgi:hypothetical protein